MATVGRRSSSTNIIIGKYFCDQERSIKLNAANQKSKAGSAQFRYKQQAFRRTRSRRREKPWNLGPLLGYGGLDLLTKSGGTCGIDRKTSFVLEALQIEILMLLI
ncbi:hypothetical protein CEXT_220801 [Caerostris extrusa]|uniref:Uncharacterized protein n=1 Tax=Caerostris extrusa TaxID=172846 RepID=A0AAV4VK60_CAEEX|nr:hypothetical protein CEXT_220801 [Caerostris extrusa]